MEICDDKNDKKERGRNGFSALFSHEAWIVGERVLYLQTNRNV